MARTLFAADYYLSTKGLTKKQKQVLRYMGRKGWVPEATMLARFEKRTLSSLMDRGLLLYPRGKRRMGLSRMGVRWAESQGYYAPRGYRPTR
jgi:hypothetical protein